MLWKMNAQLRTKVFFATRLWSHLTSIGLCLNALERAWGVATGKGSARSDSAAHPPLSRLARALGGEFHQPEQPSQCGPSLPTLYLTRAKATIPRKLTTGDTF